MKFYQFLYTNILVNLLIILDINIKTVLCAEDQKLLMILLDGFRWDYLDQPDLHLPGFQKIRQMGVKAEYLKPVYPTLSYPNYYSLVTGLYVESHGMVGNYMYDAKRNESFLIGTNPEQFNSHWWDKAEPIWVTAEKQDKRSYMYFWPGCEVTIRNVKPTICRPYKGRLSIDDYKRAVDDVLYHFKNGKADLGGIYLELFDALGHNYGPLTIQVKNLIKDMDTEMLHLIHEVQRRGLKDELNIIIFSDHGMTDMAGRILIDINKVISKQDYKAIMDAGPMSSIWPKPGKENYVYSRLKDFHPRLHVYKKEDIPERYHYKNDDHVAPVTLIADQPYWILTPEKPFYPVRKFDYKPKLGYHGYDNNNIDMRGLFLAFGPSYKANFSAKGFEAVEVYQMMSRILELTPLNHNGTWSYVKNMLTDKLPHPINGSVILSLSSMNLSLVILFSLFKHCLIFIES